MLDLTSPLVVLPVLDLCTIVLNKVFSLLLHKLTWHFSPVIYFHIDDKYLLDVVVWESAQRGHPGKYGQYGIVPFDLNVLGSAVLKTNWHRVLAKTERDLIVLSRMGRNYWMLIGWEYTTTTTTTQSSWAIVRHFVNSPSPVVLRASYHSSLSRLLIK